MECPECGSAVEQDGDRCPHCGAGLGGSVDETPTQPTADQDRYDPEPTGGHQTGGPGPGSPQGGPASPAGGTSGRQSPESQGQPTQGPRDRPTQNAAQGGGEQGTSPGGSSESAGATGAGPAAGAGGPGGGTGQSRSAETDGPESLRDSLGGFYETHLSMLPWKAGFLLGLLVYLVNFVMATVVAVAVNWLQTGQLSVQADGGAEALYNAHFTTLFSGTPPFENIPVVFGVLLLFVPWLMFSVGTRLTTWYAPPDGDWLRFTKVGATLVAGYLPAAVLASLVFPLEFGPSGLLPPEFGSILLFAGIIYPVVTGGLAGLSIWFFAEFQGLGTRFLGYLAGLVVLVGVTATSVLLMDDYLRSEGLAVAVHAVYAFVGAHLFSFPSDSKWFLVSLVPLLVLFVVGFVRARRVADRLDTLLDGVRASAPLTFAYAFVAYFMLAALVVWMEYHTRLPSSLDVGVSVGLLEVETITTAPDVFWTLIVIGVVYPFVVSGLGGVAAVAWGRR